MKRRQFSKLAFVISAMLIAAPGVAAKGGEEYPPNGTVKIEKAKNLKNLGEVLVPHFAVSFVVADSKSSVASTNRSDRFARKASSTTSATLVGLTNETMQAITDAAYADFVASLTEKGITLVEPDAAAAQAKARETKMPMTKFLDGPRKDYSLYHKAFNNHVHDVTFTPTGTQLIEPKIGSTPIPYMYGASARDLGVPVLVVDYVVTFGHISADAREYYGIAGRGSASAETSFLAGLQVMWSSDIKVYHSERKRARLMIEKNAWTAAPFATLDTDKYEGVSGSRQDITMTVDNAAYEAAALDVIARATDNLLSHLPGE